MVGLSFYGIFWNFLVIGEDNIKILATNFSPLFLLHRYSQVASIFTSISDYSAKLLLLKSLHYIDMRKIHVRIVVPKLQSSILRVTWKNVLLVQCIVPNVPVSPQNLKMIWITILLRSTAPENLMSPSSVNFVIKSFQDFELDVNIEALKTAWRSDPEQRDVDAEHIMGDVEDHRLREVAFLSTFLGAFGTWKRETQSIKLLSGNSQRNKRERETWSFFQQCAAKVNLAFGFILKNIEDGWFRYFYAHENNTLLDRSKLVCTHDDLAKLKDFLNKTDVTESCRRERTNTKWRFYKLTNLTVFAVLLKDFPLGCEEAVLSEPLLKNCTINCLTCEKNTRQPYNDNLCLFRALALHLHGNQRMEEETLTIFDLFINKTDGLSADQLQGVHMNHIPVVEDLLTLNIVLYDNDIVDGNITGELARRSLQKYNNTVRLLRYNNRICYVSNINAVFQAFRYPNCDTFFIRTSNVERHLTTCSRRVKISIRGTYINSEKLSLTS